jgi:hypothetical protein
MSECVELEEPAPVLTLLELPPELLEAVLVCVPPRSLATASCVCTAMCAAVRAAAAALGCQCSATHRFIHAMHLLDQPLLRLDVQPRSGMGPSSRSFGRARSVDAAQCVRLLPSGPPRSLVDEASRQWPCEPAKLVVRLPPSCSGSWYEAKRCVSDGASLTCHFCDGDVESGLDVADVALLGTKPVTLSDLLRDAVRDKCWVLVTDGAAPRSLSTGEWHGARWNPAHVTGVTLVGTDRTGAGTRAQGARAQAIGAQGTRAIERDGQLANRVAHELRRDRDAAHVESEGRGALFRNHVREAAAESDEALCVVTTARDEEQRREEQLLHQRRDNEWRQREHERKTADEVYR